MLRALGLAMVLAVALTAAAAAEESSADLVTLVARGDTDGLADLLSAGVAAETLNPQCPPQTRCKPITYAAEQSDPAILRLLLEAGADPNGTNSVGDNALIVAIMSGNAAGIDVLLEFGADMNQANRFGISALVGTVMMGDASLLAKLLEHGGDPNAQAVGDADSRQSVGGPPLLCVAAAGGHVAVVRLLLERGADLSPLFPSGPDPSDCIRKTGSSEMLALLPD